jgi:hypothetical protein
MTASVALKMVIIKSRFRKQNSDLVNLITNKGGIVIVKVISIDLGS